MKKIMILGAGIYQVPLILKAKKSFALVVSYPGPYPGFALADECLYLDTRDEAGILKAAREKEIQGICTTGTDVAIRALGRTAELLHLPGLSLAAAEHVTDKLTMREVFRKSIRNRKHPLLPCHFSCGKSALFRNRLLPLC